MSDVNFHPGQIQFIHVLVSKSRKERIVWKATCSLTFRLRIRCTVLEIMWFKSSSNCTSQVFSLRLKACLVFDIDRSLHSPDLDPDSVACPFARRTGVKASNFYWFNLIANVSDTSCCTVAIDLRAISIVLPWCFHTLCLSPCAGTENSDMSEMYPTVQRQVRIR